LLAGDGDEQQQHADVGDDNVAADDRDDGDEADDDNDNDNNAAGQGCRHATSSICIAIPDWFSNPGPCTYLPCMLS